MVVYQLAEVDSRTRLRGQGRLDQVCLDYGHIDVEPDKPAAVDLPADLARVEKAPRTITEIEKLGADAGRPETGFSSGWIRVRCDGVHHGSATLWQSKAYTPGRAGEIPGAAE